MPQVTGDAGTSSPLFPDRKSGVWGQSDSGYGVAGTASSGNGVQAGSITGFGAVGTSSDSIGVFGISSNNVGVYGRSDAARDGWGVIGDGTTGVYGHSASGGGYGVYGVNEGGTSGVLGTSSNIGVGGVVSAESGGSGVSGFGRLGGTGIFGGNSSESHAGVFDSGVYVDGDLSVETFVTAYSNVDTPTLNVNDISTYNAKGRIDFHTNVFMPLLLCPLKFFQIDDPRDPANKYLNHACVESSELKTIYDGIAVLDEKGETVVRLPEWFEALNGNLRYQLTPLGAAAPDLHIAEEISGNQFRISGGPGRLKVCWQVTGIRKDKVAEANPVVVEQDKPAHERGLYLHPALYGESQERGIHRVREQVNVSRAEETRRDRLNKGKEVIAAQHRFLAEHLAESKSSPLQADNATE